MTLAIKKEESANDYPRIGEGNYMARVVGVIDLGKQVRKNWKTHEVEVNKQGDPIVDRMLWVTWELPTETIEIDGEEKPRWVSKEYKLSFFEKSNLTKLVAAVSAGEELKSLDQMIDRQCMVEVGTTSGGKDKVVGVSPMVKGMVVPELQNPAQVFDIDDPDLEVWKRLPNFIKDKIQESETFKGSDLEAKLNAAKADPETKDEFDDDMPF